MKIISFAKAIASVGSIVLATLVYSVNRNSTEVAIDSMQEGSFASLHRAGVPESELEEQTLKRQGGAELRIDEARLVTKRNAKASYLSFEDSNLSNDVVESFSAAAWLVEEGFFSDVMESIFDSPTTEDFLKALKENVDVESESRAQRVTLASRSVFRNGWDAPLKSLGLDSAKYGQAELIITDAEARKLELMMQWTDDEITELQLESALADLASVESRLEFLLSPQEIASLISVRSEVIDGMSYSPEFVRLRNERASGSLFPLIYSEETSLLQAKLDAGADPNEPREGRPDDSLLSLAVSSEAEEAAFALIESGADVHFADSNGKTALHHAAESGSFELIQALLEAGADLEAKTQAGFTPAMLARIAWVFADEERPEQVQSLLRVQSQ